MKKGMLILATALLFVAAGSSAQSGSVIRTRLVGTQEVPAVSTQARGELVARVFEDRIVYRLTYSDLSSNSLFSHIHFGATATNGGVAAFLCGGSGKAACPATSGEFTGTILASDVVGPTGQGIAPGEFAELARAIRSGTTYANLHTANFPGGEIRGQITRGDEDD